MIDVVFLLIIFFLVSSHLARQESQLPLPLPDAVSGEEVEEWMVAQGLLQRSDSTPDAPIDSSCSPEQHEAQARAEAEAKGVPGKVVILD